MKAVSSLRAHGENVWKTDDARARRNALLRSCEITPEEAQADWEKQIESTFAKVAKEVIPH